MVNGLHSLQRLPTIMPFFHESLSLLSSPILDRRLAGAIPLLLPASNEADGAVAILANAFLGTLATIIIDSAPVLAAGLFRVHHVVSQDSTNFAIFAGVPNVMVAHVVIGGRRGHADDHEK